MDYGIKHWGFCIFTLWLWKNVLPSITLQDFCISSIISLPGLQCRSNYLFPFWVSSFLFYLQPKMVGLPSYPAGLIFWVGIIRCYKKKNLTHIYAYLPRLQLLSCLLQNLIHRPDCITSPLLLHTLLNPQKVGTPPCQYLAGIPPLTVLWIRKKEVRGGPPGICSCGDLSPAGKDNIPLLLAHLLRVISV